MKTTFEHDPGAVFTTRSNDLLEAAKREANDEFLSVATAELQRHGTIERDSVAHVRVRLCADGSVEVGLATERGRLFWATASPPPKGTN